jgi:O-antigen/teichoic acid export membrane protein
VTLSDKASGASGRQADVETATETRGATTRFGTQRVHKDAGSAAFASAANAILGAAFWAFAARMIPPQQLGVMTAVLALIVSSGSVVATGVGDAYTALLPAVGNARPDVYRRGQRVFFLLAAGLAIVGALVTVSLLSEVRGSVGVAILVATGIFAVGTFNLQTSTLMAIGRAAWVPAANVVLGVSKFVLLPVLAVAAGWHSVELAVVISTVLIAVFFRRIIGRIIATGQDLPDAATISDAEAPREFTRVVRQTTSLAALGVGVIILTPFLVTLFAGPSQGALFALMFSIVATLDYVAGAMAVSVAVHASSDPEHGPAMARSVLARAAVVTAVGTVVLVSTTPVVLRILNREYAHMNVLGVVSILCAATVVRVAYIVWVALQQSRRNLRMPLLFNAISVVLMLVAMPTLCEAHGAIGGALAVLIHQVFLTAAAGIHVMSSNRKKGKPQDVWA